MLPVPIASGNPLDVLPASTVARACELEFFLAENAKSARAFLKSVNHPKPIASLNIQEIGHHPDSELIAQWLTPLKNGVDIGVLSESGCPGVADPGAQLVAQAQHWGYEVVPLVGPSSILLTLMASGLDGQHFRFVGYLPIKENERATTIRELEKKSRQNSGETQLFIETPYRNNALLESLTKLCAPTTRLVVATDITGSCQTIRTQTIQEWQKLGKATLPKLPTVFGLLARN